MSKADSVVKVELNTAKITNKVSNNKLGLFVANEWYRLIGPFTPHRTGLMQETVDIRPFEIEYKQRYSAINYYNQRNFRKDFNPFATDHWDKAAEQAGQKDKLIRASNKYLGSD